MTDARILVTGSRGWASPPCPDIWEVLRIAAQEFTAHKTRLVIVHGGCPSGADLATHHWAKHHPMFGFVPVVEEIHYAAWEAQGKGAGMWRNRRMVEAGADVCLAFVLDSSRGATHCAEYAAKAGIPVRYYRAGDDA